MTDFLDEKRRDIDDRLTELKPSMEEYRQLQTVSNVLAGIPTAKEGSVHIDAACDEPQAHRRPGRPKGTGKRAAEALTLIQEQPGITVAELGSKLGIKTNYLYRVVPALAQEKMVTKIKHGWHPVK